MTKRVRITGPAQVNGQDVEVGSVVEVTEAGELHRLLHYGQAVLVDQTAPEAENKAAPRPATPETPASADAKKIEGGRK